MKVSVLLASAIGVAMLVSASTRIASAQSPSPAGGCAPAGDLRFVCGLTNVEDIVPVEAGRWLVGSSFKLGSAGLYLIDTAAKSARTVALSVSPKPDPKYPGCAAPDLHGLSTHGLAVSSSQGSPIVYAVNHGGRESIEIFRLHAAQARAEWLGCVVLPEGASGNSVTALADGGFAVTKFMDTRDKQAFQHMLSGQVTGTVYAWKPGQGFREVPGTQLPGDNGLVVSADGHWLFINAYGSSEIYRVALSGGGTPTHVKVDFHPDNLRWAPDGTLFVTGQFLNAQSLGGPHGWATVRLEPQSMQVTPVVREPGRSQFDDATSAVQVGDVLWFGTFRGDRVAYRAAQ